MDIAVPVGSLTVTGGSVGVAFTGPEVGRLSYTGRVLTVATGIVSATMAIPAGALALTGQYITVGFIQDAPGRLSYVGRVPTLASSLSLSLGKGHCAFTGRAPTLAQGLPAGSGFGLYLAPRYFAPQYFSQTGLGLTSPLTVTVMVEAYLPSGWTDITSDVQSVDGIHIRYGIDGNGPLDCVASPGECTFALKNFAEGSRPEGYYSPLHVNCRTGWTWDVPLRVSLFDPGSGRSYFKHVGRVNVIDASAGPATLGDQLVHVVSYDSIFQLLETDVRSLDIATGVTETQLIELALNSLPSYAQPLGRDFDEGVDLIDTAFHDLGEGVRALGLINDIAIDSQSFVAVRGDGVMMIKNRHSRSDGSSAGTFTNSMAEFSAQSALSESYDSVRVSIAPPLVDSAVSVVYADQTVRSLGPGETSEFWVSYSDQSDSALSLIGALDVVTPLEADVDYEANWAADGSGLDVTASVTVSVTPFSSSALVSITNGSTQRVFLVDVEGEPKFQIRGRSISSRDAQTFVADPDGIRPLSVDLRYQDSPLVAQDYADFIEQKWQSPTHPQSMGLRANRSTALMTQALAREPGDIITVTEARTGFTATDVVIQSVELDITSGPIVSCRFGLAPAAPFVMWTFDIDGLAELDINAVLGF